MSADRQRIDRWLWNARIVRTRSAAALFAVAGHVRINGLRVVSPGRDVKCGDVVTVALHAGVRVLKVVGVASRRRNAAAALQLYEDLGTHRNEGLCSAPAVTVAPVTVSPPVGRGTGGAIDTEDN